MTRTRAAALALIALVGPSLRAQNAAAPAGTAQLSGRVVTADAGSTPVRRAIVTIKGSELPLGRSVVSDDVGRFVFERLPAGHFTVTASRAAFLSMAYGAKAPGRPGTAITIAAGERAAEITIRLVRGAVIAGTVRGEDGEPVSGVGIAVILMGRAAAAASGPQLFSAAYYTDDRGGYRIYGLEAGTYLVAAASRVRAAQIERLTSDEVDAALQDLQRSASRPGTGGGADRAAPANQRPPSPYGYAPVFHPGTTSAAQATPITVAAGEERTGVDIQLSAVRLASVEGLVSATSGTLPPTQLSITSDVTSQLPAFFGSPFQLATPPGPDGRFQYVGLPPGTYTITARSTTMVTTTTPSGGGGGGSGAGGVTQSVPASNVPVLWGTTSVSVTGDDLSGVTIALQPGVRLSGRIAFDAASLTPPADLTAARLSLQTPGPLNQIAIGGAGVIGRFPVPGAQVRADGTFEFPSLIPGSYTFTASVPNAAGWIPRSAIVGGRDILDAPLEVPPASGDLTGAVVTFTDRHTELSGTLQTPTGAPAAEYVVVLFSTDRATWRPQGRRLLTTRPASDGTFTLRDMPPGSYYLAALTDLDPGDWQTPEFLDQVVPGAITLTVGEGERKRQDLQIAR